MKNKTDVFLVTKFIDPDAKINSEYGVVDGKTWIDEEKKRIGNCHIIRDKHGFIALTRYSKKRITV